jgi:hypothetical protein
MERTPNIHPLLSITAVMVMECYMGLKLTTVKLPIATVMSALEAGILNTKEGKLFGVEFYNYLKLTTHTDQGKTPPTLP